MSKRKPTANEYDKWVRTKEHMPIERYTYKGMSVFISEGGPYFYNSKKKDYPLGWYESAYAVGQDDMIICIQPLEFTFAHDIHGLTDKARRLGRINAAKRAAEAFLDQAAEKLNGR